LPPSTASPHLNLYDGLDSLTRILTPSSPTPTSPTESFDHLPIAARYASSSRRLSNKSPQLASSVPATSPAAPVPPPSATARLNAYNILTNGRPSENPTHKTSFASLNNGSIKGRSHRSLPPPARSASGQSSRPGQSFSASFARMSFQSGSEGSRKLHRNHAGRVGSGSSLSTNNNNGFNLRPGDLPNDLGKVLTVLSGGILEGHIKLAAALKKRYESQYPLVRSLSDVFTAHVSFEYLCHPLS
jgi:hypothetical protein